MASVNSGFKLEVDDTVPLTATILATDSKSGHVVCINPIIPTTSLLNFTSLRIISLKSSEDLIKNTHGKYQSDIMNSMNSMEF